MAPNPLSRRYQRGMLLGKRLRRPDCDVQLHGEWNIFKCTKRGVVHVTSRAPTYVMEYNIQEYKQSCLHYVYHQSLLLVANVTHVQRCLQFMKCTDNSNIIRLDTERPMKTNEDNYSSHEPCSTRLHVGRKGLSPSIVNIVDSMKEELDSDTGNRRRNN